MTKITKVMKWLILIAGEIKKKCFDRKGEKEKRNEERKKRRNGNYKK